MSLNAKKRLKESGRSNVLYKLAKGLATMRKDGMESKFPTRMPMGLLEYMVAFYESDTIQRVKLVCII